jgi:uncharacterized protein YbjT (DUF2867 family)
LVGQHVLRLALADPRVATVVAPTRRPLPTHPRLENPIVDFDHLPADAVWWSVDTVISTLGTTIKAAGSPDAFRKVDHDYVLAVARAGLAHGARAFVLTSAFGADASSRVFYNRVKGETEQSVAALGYRSLTIVRPGLIGGERKEWRPAERLAMRVLRVIGPLLPRRYRISPVDHIARAELDAAVAAAAGRRLIESDVLAG